MLRGSCIPIDIRRRESLLSKDTGEWITPNYETISAMEKRQICELVNSTLLNAFSEQDFMDVLAVFQRVIERLEESGNV